MTTVNLDAANGAVLVGTADGTSINPTVTQTAILDGASILTSPVYVPREAEAVSFEIHATQTSGTPTLTVVVRSANRAGASMVDRGVTSPTALAAIASTAAAVLTVPADTNYYQLEISCAGGNATVSVIAAARDSAAAAAAGGAVSGTVAVSNFPATQPVSGTVAVSNFPASQAVTAAALPLPSGASTAAKQPALGTAGVASADVITVQGIASGVALPMSAAALPLPSGAATAAKQPALGTAGAASADVLTIQGVASMKELLVQLIAGAAAIGTVGVTSVSPPSAIFADIKNVSVAGTRVALGASQALKRGVTITARLSNGGSVYVGAAATVSSTVYGRELKSGESCFVECDNLNLVGLDAATNGEGVSYIAS